MFGLVFKILVEGGFFMYNLYLSSLWSDIVKSSIYDREFGFWRKVKEGSFLLFVGMLIYILVVFNF